MELPGTTEGALEGMIVKDGAEGQGLTTAGAEGVQDQYKCRQV